MRPDPASTLPERLHGPETHRVAAREGLSAARGLLVGVVLGLAFWASVIGLAWAVWLLA